MSLTPTPSAAARLSRHRSKTGVKATSRASSQSRRCRRARSRSAARRRLPACAPPAADSRSPPRSRHRMSEHGSKRQPKGRRPHRRRRPQRRRGRARRIVSEPSCAVACAAGEPGLLALRRAISSRYRDASSSPSARSKLASGCAAGLPRDGPATRRRKRPRRVTRRRQRPRRRRDGASARAEAVHASATVPAARGVHRASFAPAFAAETSVAPDGILKRLRN